MQPSRKDPLKPTVAVGKRVGGSLYVHKDALPLIGDLARSVEEAERLADRPNWNVAKVEKTSISLLLYEPFEEDFPALLASVKVPLLSGKITRTCYAQRANPPILHRKELLLPPNDPRLPRFRALTRAAEEHGLFANPNRIGTREAWNALIANAGLTLHKGRLLSIGEHKVDVARHRTAIVRRDLSQPMQLMMRLGIVTKTRSLFDYGCGQGEDVAALRADGYRAFGWDPHHAMDGIRAPAEIVNLGFVLNVIEDTRERLETLKAAWDFAEKALCVAVMRYGKVSTSGWKPYGDGVLTSRGTFQKYFRQQELHYYVAEATGQKPLALAPGIIVVFRDKDLEQEVLLRRHSPASADALPRPPERPRLLPPRSPIHQRLAGVLERFAVLPCRSVDYRNLRRCPNEQLTLSWHFVRHGHGPLICFAKNWQATKPFSNPAPRVAMTSSSTWRSCNSPARPGTAAFRNRFRRTSRPSSAVTPPPLTRVAEVYLPSETATHFVEIFRVPSKTATAACEAITGSDFARQFSVASRLAYGSW
jgi:hypothetical protein